MDTLALPENGADDVDGFSSHYSYESGDDAKALTKPAGELSMAE